MIEEQEKEQEFLSWLKFQKDAYGGPNILIVKTIRADSKDFSNLFVTGLFQDLYQKLGKPLEEIRLPLRKPLPKNSFYTHKVTSQGVINLLPGSDGRMRTETPHYDPQVKYGSKKQSVTIIGLRQGCLPDVFGLNTARKEALTGIIFASNNFEADDHFLFGRYATIYDGGTVGRLNYHASQDAAQRYFEYKKDVLCENHETLVKKGLELQKSNIHHYNESLVRLKYLPGDPRCQIGVFQDNLLSRLLAQFRVIDFKENSHSSFVPIMFYLPDKKQYSPYTLEAQAKDLNFGLQSGDILVKALAMIVNFYNQNKNNTQLPLANFFKEIEEMKNQSVKEEIYKWLSHPGRMSGFGRFQLLNLMSQNNILEFRKDLVVDDAYLGENLPEEIAKYFRENFYLDQLEGAIRNRQINRLKLLLDKNNKSIDYSGIWFIAIENNCLEAARLLLDNGVEINASNDLHQTALIIAVENGDLDTVEMLLKNGADVNLVDDADEAALMIAARAGHLDIVNALLRHGVDVNVANTSNNTVLMMAARAGHPGVVEVLLRHDADIDAVGKYGQTALMVAARNGYLEVVKMLLERNANVNAVADRGYTALMQAAISNHVDVVNALLERGANVEAVAEFGRTVIDLANEHGRENIINILEQHKSNVVPGNAAKIKKGSR